MHTLGHAGVTRRDFLKTSAAVTAGAALTGLAASRAHAAGSDALKVGLIGCGGRGTEAAANCVASAPNVQVWALGDLFPERMRAAAKKHEIPPERCFGGFDAYEKVLASGVDIVILAAPPGFRPAHFEAAVKAGKHVFMEKPVCVDPVGYHRVVAAADLAAAGKLCVVAGTQRRHQKEYLECMKRIKDGAIGEITVGQCYWIGGPVHHNGQQTPSMSDIEFQCRNWYNWTWLCGDHIVEQHVHNIDIMLWALGRPPERAIGFGGCQARPEKGNIWDHFAVEFEFAGGVRVASYCAQFDKINGRVGESLTGTKGKASCGWSISGKKPWKFEGEALNPYVQEHMDLVAAIRGAGPYINEGRQVADSSMTAVLGRMAAYTGREVSWKWATETSKLDLAPPKLEFGPFTPHPTPVPGRTELL